MTDEIPLEGSSVDLVWCSEVLEHVPDTAGLLSEVRRVLKTGGRLLATTPSHDLPRRAHGGVTKSASANWAGWPSAVAARGRPDLPRRGLRRQRRRALIALLRWEEHFDPLGQHVRFYSRRSLTRTLETFAFEDVEVSSQRGMLVARARKARLF